MGPSLTGAVLAGGQSTRMGRDKALLTGADGRPLVAGVLDALRRAGCSALLIGANDPAPFAGLGVPVVSDPAPGQGPLGGLAAVLAAATTDRVVVVACDMPALDPALLGDLARRTRAGDHDAVVPRSRGQLHPLHAVYRRRCLPTVEAALAAGRRSLRRLLEDLDVDVVECGASASFTNLNTPEELAAWERRGGPRAP